MRKLFFLAVLTSILIATSCKKNKPFRDFEGSWSGNYIGDDTGIWTANIDEKGSINGSAMSDSFQGFSFDLTGSISEEGEFSAEAEVLKGSIEFSGSINKSTASGVWTNDEAGINGSWSGEKD